MDEVSSVATTFYEAFAQRDGDRMADCYSDHVKFSDPVFPRLVGHEARLMWKMLCSTANDLKIEHSIALMDGNLVEVTWDAWYTFSKTGRSVHNEITARMVIKDRKIVAHQDYFNFWRWSTQALGLTGMALGWTPIIRRGVQTQAAKSLKAYISKQNAIT